MPVAERKPVKKAIFGVATLLACAACGAEPASESESDADEAIKTVELDNIAPSASCPFYVFTCSRGGTYSSMSACTTACGTAKCLYRVNTSRCIPH